MTKVTKASGETEHFEESKLFRSLRNSGASEPLAHLVISQVTPSLFEGVTTKKIYKDAFDLLKKESQSLASRYGLKKALMELGPSGHPFERLVAGIFENDDYETKTNLTYRGKCVSHEIDVEAIRENTRHLMECKYRNTWGNRCDVKVSLYVFARSLDLRNTEKYDQFWLVTNAKFTQDALDYGNCAGLKMLGWGTPKGNGIFERTVKAGLYPISCLHSLKKRTLSTLLAEGVALCRQILENPTILEKTEATDSEKKQIMKEIGNLFKNGTL